MNLGCLLAVAADFLVPHLLPLCREHVGENLWKWALNTALAELVPLLCSGSFPRAVVLMRVNLCFTPPQADCPHPCLAALSSHSCCFPCPSPLACHWGKEGKHLLSCTSLLSPWVRSVGSSLWLCTVRRFCRICLRSCWRSIAGIPDLLVFLPHLPEVVSRCSQVVPAVWGLLWGEAVLPSCLTPKSPSVAV